MSEQFEDDEVYAVSERHSQIMEEGDQFVGGVCVTVLVGLLVVLVIAGFFILEILS